MTRSRFKLIRSAFALLAALALAGMTTPSRAADGSIRIHLVKAGVVFGVSNGTGTLIFRRHAYPLTITGASFGATVGISEADLSGIVRNIRRPTEIIGAYSAGQAGLSIGTGQTRVTLTNSNGAVLDLLGPQVGFAFSLDLNGMQISMPLPVRRRR
jgi:hypothetical protein